MTVVFDTSVLIDMLRNYGPALAFGEKLAERPLCSEISRVEVIRGLRSHERPGAEELFGGLGWVPLDERIARHAGELGREWRRSHPGMGAPDLVVAATALELGAKLATTNVKHFPMFKGLRPPYRPQ